MDPEETAFFQQNGITCQEIIAKGGYGEVYLVYSSVYKQTYALKKIPEKLFNQSEIDCLKAIDDVNIVSLYQYYKFGEFYYMLMEYCPNDLDKLVRKSPELPPEYLMRYAHDILIAVKACHDRHIAHSDIKPSNFMIDRYGRVKIGDFGLSSIYKDHPTSNLFKGTRLFMAPEIFLFKEYDPMAADVWAIGVTIFYLATKTYPFYSNDPRVLLQKIEKGVYCDKNIDDPNLRMVISRCIEPDPHYRAKISELLQMPYFAPYNQPQPERISIFPRGENMKSQQLIVKPQIAGRRASIGAISILKMKGMMGSRLQLNQPQNKSVETFNLGD